MGRGSWRRGARRLLLVGTLAAFAAVALAGTAQAADLGEPGASVLNVQLTGTGAGTIVQSSGPGNGTALAINCSKAAGAGQPSTGVCSENIPFTAPPQPWVGVTAQPSAASEFAGWTVPAGVSVAPGYCGLNPTCIVEMDGVGLQLSALFTGTPNTPVTIFRAGPQGNQGSVTSNPVGINCTPTDAFDCTHSFPIGSSLTLTATTPAGTTFGGWSAPTGYPPPACAQGPASPTCTIVVGTAPLAFTATFSTQQYALTVSETGAGGVSSNVQPGIQCGDGASTCTANFAGGTQVILTAQPAAGALFKGWGGACSGTTTTCTVTMSQAQSVTASFGAAVVDASVTGNKVVYSSRNPKRVLQIKVSAGQEVNVKIQLKKGGVNYASKTVKGVDEGASVLTLKIGNSVAAGQYTAVITFTNNQGAPPLVVNRSVKLKAVPS